ncbi:MAG: hypothetical protein NVS4B8_12710 [Herpetosiphon sp.]
MVLQLTWQFLLSLPFLIIGIANGWNRGWRDEAITTVALLAALLFFGNRALADLMGTLVNRVVDAFALFFSALLGRNIGSRALVTRDNTQFFRFIGFVISAGLSYAIGDALGTNRGLTRTGRALGAVLGGVNVFLIASQLFSYLQRFLPAIFQREGTIHITPDTDAIVLRSALPTIFALLLVLLLIVIFIRLPRMRQ